MISDSRKVNIRQITYTAIIIVSLLTLTDLIRGFWTITPGIEMKRLEYRDGYVGQTRRVTGKDSVVASWVARVRDDRGKSVCRGSGFWQYALGEDKKWIQLNEWVGDDKCLRSLTEHVRYQLCVRMVWSDGDNTALCSDGFFFTDDDREAFVGGSPDRSNQ